MSRVSTPAPNETGDGVCREVRSGTGEVPVCGTGGSFVGNEPVRKAVKERKKGQRTRSLINWDSPQRSTFIDRSDEHFLL